MTAVEVVDGDITALAVDAIANAANTSLLPEFLVLLPSVPRTTSIRLAVAWSLVGWLPWP